MGILTGTTTPTKVDLRVMTMKASSTFRKAPGRVLRHIVGAEVLLLCRDAVGLTHPTGMPKPSL